MLPERGKQLSIELEVVYQVNGLRSRSFTGNRSETFSAIKLKSPKDYRGTFP